MQFVWLDGQSRQSCFVWLILGFPMANGNLAITTVFATFLPTLIHSKSRSKSNDKFTAVYAVYRKRQTYHKFSAVNGKQKIHTYIWWVYANNVWKKNYSLFTVSINFTITVETLLQFLWFDFPLSEHKNTETEFHLKSNNNTDKN